jgi:hypothetical protein
LRFWHNLEPGQFEQRHIEGSRVFEVTPQDIANLNDVDLRELVGRLCEAELSSKGLSSAAVTWGGSQTAPDGGLDVRVALPVGSRVDGFVPRAETGFQVKTPDMGKAAIAKEMSPAGILRPVIKELADASGAYIIVSSHGSTADNPLKQRQKAMRDSLDDLANREKLHTDFYDRTRLASWVRLHPGVATWAQRKLGRGIQGWQPYGSWSRAAEDESSEYLLDEALRLRLGIHRHAELRPIPDTIDELRDALAAPRKVVRLVGLSGVGKTRFVQALFDARIGGRPLARSLAVYTDLADNPNPQPTGLVSDLIANRLRAIVVVDNCPPDLHRSLSKICSARGSQVSLITIEYDVRDDQPEETQVVTLDTASEELIEHLISQRFAHISKVDARTIAGVSGGNARVALAIAGTVQLSDSLAGLSDNQIFERLFYQRHLPDGDLLRAAEVISLLYSFHGEDLDTDGAEIRRLATLAGQSAPDLYSRVAELHRRDLVQHRGPWRALLPHALANRLAARALQNITYSQIESTLLKGESDRTMRSLSRRLSFLHESEAAVRIVEGWLAPLGLLSDLANLNEVGKAVFANVAPVSPEATLAAMERLGEGPADKALAFWTEHYSLLRSLAYDASMFERSATLLLQVACRSGDNRRKEGASNTFISLFALHLSGTHASAAQRLRVIESLLRSTVQTEVDLGLSALEKFLDVARGSSAGKFDFGARPRDYGYRPSVRADITTWCEEALQLIDKLVISERIQAPALRRLVGESLRQLWLMGEVWNSVERLSLRFSQAQFWPEGWNTCRLILRQKGKGLNSESLVRLTALSQQLEPSTLSEKCLAVVNGPAADFFDEDETLEFTQQVERFDAKVMELGTAAASDTKAFEALLPALANGNEKVWTLGRGFARASRAPRDIWITMVTYFEQSEPERVSERALNGFLNELHRTQPETAQELLDEALGHSILKAYLPSLQASVELDKRGVDRLVHALHHGYAPIFAYSAFSYGRITDSLEGSEAKRLILAISEQQGGFSVAAEVLFMRLYASELSSRPIANEVLDAGRALLLKGTFSETDAQDRHLAGIAKTCLSGEALSIVAASVAADLREKVATYKTHAFDNGELLKALLLAHPDAVLTALFTGSAKEQQSGVEVFDHIHEHRENPADALPVDSLLKWCEQEPARFALAAQFISFDAEGDGALSWSAQALALLTSAPNPGEVLRVFVERFRPMSWSGSRATAIETNARLLDLLPPEFPSHLHVVVDQAKKELAGEANNERSAEARRDAVRDERFEP